MTIFIGCLKNFLIQKIQYPSPLFFLVVSTRPSMLPTCLEIYLFTLNQIDSDLKNKPLLFQLKRISNSMSDSILFSRKLHSRFKQTYCYLEEEKKFKIRTKLVGILNLAQTRGGNICSLAVTYCEHPKSRRVYHSLTPFFPSCDSMMSTYI